MGCGRGITGTCSRKQGPERGTDAREARREWRLTGIQTVADSVLPGAKKSATEGKTEAFEDGLNAGLSKKAEEAARNALAMKLSPEQVSQITGLSKEKILELKNKIQ